MLISKKPKKGEEKYILSQPDVLKRTHPSRLHFLGSTLFWKTFHCSGTMLLISMCVWRVLNTLIKRGNICEPVVSLLLVITQSLRWERNTNCGGMNKWKATEQLKQNNWKMETFSVKNRPTEWRKKEVLKTHLIYSHLCHSQINMNTSRLIFFFCIFYGSIIL